MSGITIRHAREDEFDAVAQIWVQGWLSPLDGEPATPPDNLFEMLRARIPRELDAGWILHIAVHDARVVGLSAIKPAERHLDQLYVDETLRSRGVGKILLDHVKAQMPAGFWLRTHSRNLRAQRFYRRESLVHLRDEPHPRHPDDLFSLFEWQPDN